MPGPGGHRGGPGMGHGGMGPRPMGPGGGFGHGPMPPHHHMRTGHRSYHGGCCSGCLIPVLGVIATFVLIFAMIF